ncbi:hypothetical protein FB451DRAFT_1195486 [Mycena latifolia]|nr:hypothetical protein FB451DRAFT_1195486 [Mycena latifolia]
MLYAIGADNSRWDNRIGLERGPLPLALLHFVSSVGMVRDGAAVHSCRRKMSLAADQSKYRTLGLAACVLGVVSTIHEHPAGFPSLVSAPCGSLCTTEDCGHGDLRGATHPNLNTMAARMVKWQEAKRECEPENVQQEESATAAAQGRVLTPPAPPCGARGHGSSSTRAAPNSSGSDPAVAPDSSGNDHTNLSHDEGTGVQEAEPADIDERDAGQVVERLDDAVILIVDNGAAALAVSAVAHLSLLAFSDLRRAVASSVLVKDSAAEATMKGTSSICSMRRGPAKATPIQQAPKRPQSGTGSG